MKKSIIYLSQNQNEASLHSVYMTLLFRLDIQDNALVHFIPQHAIGVSENIAQPTSYHFLMPFYNHTLWENGEDHLPVTDNSNLAILFSEDASGVE